MSTSLRRPLALLGGISPATFMREYWQRKPLLIRQAVPDIADSFCADDLFLLAQDDDVESRLVERRRGRWHLTHGPFFQDPREPQHAFDQEGGDDGDDDATTPARGRAKRARPTAKASGLPRKDWSLLVQGVDLFDDDAAALLKQFRFIPDARLDDMMISYAVDGGGVGPHFDSYDVFLLQAQGQRRWRISAQTDLTLDPAQPMKILQRFVPEQEWVLNPGDMLYLPPHIAHDGIAIGESMTCSIGFRAADETELTVQFLHTLAEQIADARARDDIAQSRADALAAGPRSQAGDSGRSKRRQKPVVNRLYRDPDQPAVTTPAALPAGLIAHTQAVLSRVSWDKTSVSAFLGRYLSEPKANVYFDPPARRLSRESFLKRLLAQGLHLDNRSRMLYDDQGIYLNGDTLPLDEWADLVANASAESVVRTSGNASETVRASGGNRRAQSGANISQQARVTVNRARKTLRAPLTKLADQRTLEPDDFVTLSHDSPIVSAWHEWYLAGWIRLGLASD